MKKRQPVNKLPSRADVLRALQIAKNERANSENRPPKSRSNYQSLPSSKMIEEVLRSRKLKKASEEKIEFDNLFGRIPYNLNLNYRDIFGVLCFLESFELIGMCLGVDEELLCAKEVMECMPIIINSDEDIEKWLQNMEQKGKIADITIGDLGPYSESIELFKKAIVEAKKNQDSMNFERAEKIQNRPSVDFMFDNYNNQDLVCLTGDQIEIAIKKREMALSLLYDIEEMFGELKMQFIRHDEKTGIRTQPVTPTS